MNADGKEMSVSTISPGCSVVQNAFVGHVWTVKKKSTNEKLISILAPQDPMSLIITNSRSYKDSIEDLETEIEIKNQINEAVNLYFVDPDENEKYYHTLKPGESFV